MGEEMFRLTDRKGAELVLAMTHEEIVDLRSRPSCRPTASCRSSGTTFQTKFRDEPRPKSGLMRVREFTMKDSYSFDVDEAGLDASFEAHRGAYERIFARLGIPAIGVEASSGIMGGSDSVEFVCPSDAGEDLIARCGDAGLRLRRQPGEGDLGAAADRGRAGPGRARAAADPGRAHDRRPGHGSTASRPTGRSRRWCT